MKQFNAVSNLKRAPRRRPEEPRLSPGKVTTDNKALALTTDTCGIKRCLCTSASPARLLESANESLCDAGDQRPRLVPRAAMNINVEHSWPSPRLTRENQLSVCVSVSAEVPHGSFTQPPPPLKGIHRRVGGVDTCPKMMCFVADVASSTAAGNARADGKPAKSSVTAGGGAHLEADEDQRDQI